MPRPSRESHPVWTRSPGRDRRGSCFGVVPWGPASATRPQSWLAAQPPPCCASSPRPHPPSARPAEGKADCVPWLQLCRWLDIKSQVLTYLAWWAAELTSGTWLVPSLPLLTGASLVTLGSLPLRSLPYGVAPLHLLSSPCLCSERSVCPAGSRCSLGWLAQVSIQTPPSRGNE